MRDKPDRYLKWTLIILVSFFTFSSLFSKLGYENINVDQFLWYERSENFFKAIKDGKLSDTYQQYHPGVTLMYLIGLGQFSYRLFTGGISNQSNIDYQNYGLYNFHTKLYVVIFCLSILIFSSFLVYKITKSKFISVSFFVLLMSESYFIGIIRNLHMDGILTVLIFSSVMSFYIGCREISVKYFVISGILTGLGFLTKSVSFLIPLFCLIIFIPTLLRNKKDSKKLIKLGILWTFISFLVFFSLFPALWVSPFETVSKIIRDGVLNTGVSGSFNHYLNNTMTDDPGLFFYVKVLAYRITPVIQILLLVFPIELIALGFKRRGSKKLSSSDIYVFSFIFSVIYFIVFTLMKKKTDRYMAPLYPFLALLASYSLSLLSESFKELKIDKISKAILGTIVLGLSVLYYSWNFFTIKPYFLAYYSHLFGGINYAQREMYINQGGIGVFEIADYLESLNLPGDSRVAATNGRELQKVTKYNVEAPFPHMKKEYDLVIVPLQQDGFFEWKDKVVKTFYIQNQKYWRVYSDLNVR